MPNFDGTGPQGLGPLSGRGEGHCAIRLSESGPAPRGYIGIEGAPVGRGSSSPQPRIGSRITRWMQPIQWLGCTFWRGRGPGRSGIRQGRRR